MKIAEILLQDYDQEILGVRRTLERIPEPNPDYKPHEKSMAMGRLAMHVAYLPLFGKLILSEPGLDLAAGGISPDLTFKSTDLMLEAFDSTARELRAVLAAISDEDLQKTWRFSFGQHVISDVSRSQTYRMMFFNHMVHHRAQLGVYLRLNGVAVPGLYGPSADEPFGT